jgi:hypothetical protein
MNIVHLKIQLDNIFNLVREIFFEAMLARLLFYHHQCVFFVRGNTLLVDTTHLITSCCHHNLSCVSTQQANPQKMATKPPEYDRKALHDNFYFKPIESKNDQWECNKCHHCTKKQDCSHGYENLKSHAKVCFGEDYLENFVKSVTEAMEH